MKSRRSMHFNQKSHVWFIAYVYELSDSVSQTHTVCLRLSASRYSSRLAKPNTSRPVRLERPPDLSQPFHNTISLPNSYATSFNPHALRSMTSKLSSFHRAYNRVLWSPSLHPVPSASGNQCMHLEIGLHTTTRGAKKSRPHASHAKLQRHASTALRRSR